MIRKTLICCTHIFIYTSKPISTFSLQTLQDLVQALEEDIQNVGNEVKKEDYPNINFTPVKQRVKTLANRCAALRRQVNEHVTWLEKVIEEISFFVNATDDLQQFVSGAFDKLDNFDPIDNDAEVIKEQLEEVQVRHRMMLHA